MEKSTGGKKKTFFVYGVIGIPSQPPNLGGSSDPGIILKNFPTYHTLKFGFFAKGGGFS